MIYLLSTSNPWSSRVWFSSLINEFLAASMPKVPAISKTLFVLTFCLSIPLTSNTLAMLEPVVCITHSSSFWTNVTRSISGTPLTVVLRTLFLIAIDVARNVLQTKVSALIADSETDYSTEIKLILSVQRLKERGCTIAEVEAALSSNKKFKMETTGELITLKLVEESDTATTIAIRNKVLKTTVKGVPDIERVTLVQKDDEWVIQTTGSNIAKVFEVKGVDKRNVRTNNVFEIAGTLGIEAARNSLINELNHTLEDQGLEVDNRYIMLVSDLMCSRGYMQQIGRHGIAGTKDSVLARAAFEITVPTIARAALMGEVEQLKGITENVIVGSNIPIGSGTVDLYMQVSKKKWGTKIKLSSE